MARFKWIKENRKQGITLPFISSRALWASSSEAKVTNPNPFDLSETLSDTIWAAKNK